MDVYLRGKRIKLDPTRSLGKGGEADVFDLGGGRALKLFKTPDHPDYQGLPIEQKAAEQRIALHQKKLRAFPAGLPRQVIAPEELATDRSGRSVVGYVMQVVAPAEPARSVWRTELQARRCCQPGRRQAVPRDSHRGVRPPRGRGRDRRLQ